MIIEQKQVPRQFFNTSPIILESPPKDLNHVDYSSCNIDIKVKWITSVGSSVYAPPVIHPIGRNNDKKSIILSTFYDYIEMINSDGSKPLGWPLNLEGSSFQGSPLLYDIDGDGNNDLCVVDKNANIYWIRIGEVGQYLEDYHVQVPKLKVKKDWYKSIDSTFVDRYAAFSMFDRVEHNPYDMMESEAGDKKKPSNKVKIDDLFTHITQDTYPMISKASKEAIAAEQASGFNPNSQSRRKLHYVGERESYDNNKYVGRRLLEEESIPSSSPTIHSSITSSQVQVSEETEDPEELAYAEGMKVLEENEGSEESEGADAFLGGQFGDGGEGHLPNMDGYKFDDYRAALKNEHGGYRSFDDGMHYYMMNAGITNEADVVYIDPHVLSAPSLIDIDGDGKVELIVAVSYYFDAADYPTPGNDEIDRSMYVAGGIACWDIENQDWVWLVHLDMSTDKTRYKAYIHAAPTIADLDGDGRYEILIGTSLGLLYLLDGDTGFVRRHFPIQFHAIEAQIVVADIHGTSELEIIVADMAGNLVALSTTGDVIWDIQLSGALPYTPTIGDVDGDGQLDIVVVAISDIEDPTTTSDLKSNSTVESSSNSSASHVNSTSSKRISHSHSHVYAIHGATGKILEGYPVSLPRSGRATGPVILADLHDHSVESSIIPNKSNYKSKYSDPNLPNWMATPEIIFAHMSTTRNGAPVLSPSLDNYSNMSHKESVEARKRLANRGLHMLIPSFDGHIYILSKSSALAGPMRGGRPLFDSLSPTACAQRIDIGEHIASIPLISDIDENGLIDIVIGTLNGQVYALETKIAAHPLNLWNSFPKYRGNSVVTHGSVGISIPELEKKTLRYSDIKGSKNHQISITFDIWDNRPVTSESKRKYMVSITRGTSKRTTIGDGEYFKPGRYTLHVDVAPPEAMTLVVGMTTEHGMYYEDTVWVSVSTRFYVWMKYLPTIPVVLLCLPLLLMRKQRRLY